MSVSVSERGDPAEINFKTDSADSLEVRPDSFRAGSTLGSDCVGDRPAVSIKVLSLANPEEDAPDFPSACNLLHPPLAMTNSSRQQGLVFESGSGVQQSILDVFYVAAESGLIAEFLLESESPFHFD
jgi:hypothetical protein